MRKWPEPLFRLIADGIIKILREDFPECYPVHDNQKYPEGVIFDCPGCEQSLGMKNTKHTRNAEPPLLYKFHNLVPEGVSCPACIRGLANNNPLHTLTTGECNAVDMLRREGRRRRAGPTRDPGGRANGDSSVRNRLPDDEMKMEHQA